MFRKFVCLCLMSAALLLALSLAICFLAPADSAASWTGWSFLWLSKGGWQRANLALQAVTLVLAGLYLGLSREAVKANFSSGLAVAKGVNLLAIPAFLLGLYILLAGANAWPPFGRVFEWRLKSTEEYQRVHGSPPYAFAEDTPLEVLAKRLGLDPAKVLETLAKRSVVVESPLQTLRDVAEKNRLKPSGVFDAARHASDSVLPEEPGLPAEPPRALGKLKLSDICEQYGLNLPRMLQKLASSGYKATADQTLQEIAQANRVLSIDIYEALRAPFTGEAKTQTPFSPAPAVPASSQAPAAPAQPGPVAPAAPAIPDAPVSAAPPVEAPAGPAATLAPVNVAPENLAKTMLGAYCKEHGIELDKALAKLKAKKITAFGDMSFNEIALENQLTPEDVLNIVTR